MQQELDIIDAVFQVKVREEDLGKMVEEILEWNSFMIMQLMTEVFNRYQKNINVMQIAGIETVRDLIELLQNCRSL